MRWDTDTAIPRHSQSDSRANARTRRFSRVLTATLLAALVVGLLAPAAVTARRGGSSVDAWVLTADGDLLNVQVDGSARERSRVAVSGLRADEWLVGIDIRPATGELFAIGSSSQVYRVNTQTGRASRVGSPFTPALSGSSFGVDFNPTVDRIRVVSDSGQNLRINPDNGVAINDKALSYPTEPRAPWVAAAGYTNSVAGASSTMLYNLDARYDTLVTQMPANDGTLSTVGSLGINITASTAFDIILFPQSSGLNNIGFAAANLNDSGNVSLLQVDLATGSAKIFGTIAGETVVGMAAYVR